MKILYGIQGTGNGHLSRAMEIVPALKKRAEVDLLVSGMHSEIKLPFEVKYLCHGLGFVFGKKGGIDLLETYRKSRLRKFYKEVKSLKLDQYDLIISDFEPVTAWASLQASRKCIGLSNQVSLLSPSVPKAKNEDFVGRFIIRNYAPCAINFGFSYQEYDRGIYTPVIRKSLRNASLSSEGHVVVYLPSFSDEKVVKTLSQIKDVEWRVFSKHAQKPWIKGNVYVNPLDKDLFEKSIVSATGIVTAAGFGTTTEALFMSKKLLVIPQKHQYEQACNATALAAMGVSVIKSIKEKHLDKITEWVEAKEAVNMVYPDITDQLVDDMIQTHHQFDDAYVDYLTQEQYLLKQA